MPRLRHARGPRRPRYTDSRGADRAVIMVLALGAEVAALRDRLDTHEQLAQLGIVATPEAIERYEPSPVVGQARATRRQAMVDRVTRVLLDDAAVDAAQSGRIPDA